MATLRELIIKISANSQSFQSEIARASRMGENYYKTMQNGGRNAAVTSRESQRALAEVNAQLASVRSAALGMTGALAGAFATGNLISLADQWNMVNARLKQASVSTQDFTSNQAALMALSQRTGTAFSDNAGLFARSAASLREYGYTSQDALKVTEALATGLKLSGAGVQESSSVITQFSQALAQGVLRGEEFNSVNENGDRVIRALAAGMGVARKDLKAMADDGKLTADKVVPALISQLGAMQNEFAAMPATVGGSITKVQNSFQQWVGGVNETSRITATLSGTLDSLADNIDDVATAAGVLVAVGAARYFGSMASGAYSATAGIISAAKSEVALADAQLRGTQIAVSRARSAVYRAQQALVAARGTDEQARAERRLASAQLAVTRNVAARTAAQTTLNNVTAVGSRLMSGALGLVGGVPGLLMLGAGAWYYMYQNQEQARRSAQEYASTIDEIRQKSGAMSLADASDNYNKTQSSLSEQNRLIDEQKEKIRLIRVEIEGYQQILANPGLTVGGYMVNHLMSVEDATNGLSAATEGLSVEQDRLSRLQGKAQDIQSVLEGLEHRRVVLIRQQAAEQNAAYQSLLRMNGQHTEFNRLLSLGNDLLSARQGNASFPFRVPDAALTDKQKDALEKSRQDLEISKLKGEAKELARLRYSADELGLTDSPANQKSRQDYINNNLEKWRNDEANKPTKKGPKTDEEKAVDTYDRLIKQQREQLALGSQNTELAKIKYQTSQGELSTLTSIQKQELARNAALIDQREIYEKLKTFKDSLSENNASARERNNVDFIGMGDGERARERMREIISIQSDFAKQQRELQRDFQNGSISEDLYKKETEALKEALSERLEIQSEYYKSSDEQRADWLGGVTDRLATFADEATNYSQMAADATSSILDGATSSIANGLEGIINGSMSASEALKNAFAGMGQAVIQTLTDMAAQWLVYQAVQLVVEKTTQGSKTPAMVSNAQATALQAQLAAYASTAAIPIIGPAAAPAAMAAAAAVTTPLVAAISASALAGMAHDGIDRVPETGTWLLQKGERVVTAKTSAKLDSTLAMVQQQKQEERESAAAGFIYSPTIQVNGDPDDRTMVMMQNAVRQGAMQGYQMVVNHLASGQGQVSKALGSGWGTSRRKR
ncbi:phage tail tape measure protein [Pectobacterium carotovorum]|uniref:phage tail tape measure protein n=1 Tax=Pectobacterium carotovorum TaxID=554 RepID=UPI00386B6826